MGDIGLCPDHALRCGVDGCDRRLHRRDPALCSMHAARWAKHGDPDTVKRRRFDPAATERVCKTCGDVRPVAEYLDRNGNTRTANCRSCNRTRAQQAAATPEGQQRAREYAKAWRAANRERHRQYMRRGAGRRRAAKEATEVYEVTDRDLARIRSAPCLACGSRERIEVDHLVPVTRGGAWSVGNLIPLCRRCNASKNRLTWAEWKHSGRPRAMAVFATTRRPVQATR